MFNSSVGFSGSLTSKVIRPSNNKRWEIFKWHCRNWLEYRWRDLPLHFAMPLLRLLDRWLPISIMYGTLRMKVIKSNGDVWDYGVVGCHTITDVGENFIVDAWQNSVELEIMKYHGIGTGTTASADTDTALQTELTTQYQTDNTRATGTTAEGNQTNEFSTVATNTVDATVAITEWGLLSQAAVGGGVLFDRQVFSVINLSSGDSLQTTYELDVGVSRD